MEEICKEEYYIEAFDTLMQAFDKNDIAFGNGKFWAVNMVRQACIIADVDSHIRFGQWISVNDRLPDETGFYFVYAPSYRCGSSSGIRSYDGMMVTKFMNGKRWGAEIQSYNKKCVTHWMPLPDAPKE